MSDYAALAYLDFCRMRNAVRMVLRTPSRLGLWVLYLLWFAFMLFTRIATGHVNRAVPGISDPLASLIMFGYVFALGVMILRAANGHVGAFASTADARFLTSSHLSERAVVTWLQLRSSAMLIGRLLFLIVLYSMIFNRAGSFFGLPLAMLAGAALAGALPIPALALARRADGASVLAFAYLLMAAGLLCAVVLVAPLMHVLLPSAVTTAVVSLHAGVALRALLFGNAAALLILCACAAAMTIAAYACARDLYPELYQASLSGFARLERMRDLRLGRAGTTAYMRPRTSSVPAALNGGWAFIWKDWIGLRRARRFVQVMLWTLGFWLALGIGTALFVNSAKDAAAMLITLGVIFANVLFFFTVISAVTLAGDLRKPIFWLGPDPLRVRFYAWVIAGSWRLAAGFLVALAAHCAFRNSWTVFLAGAPIAIALPPLLRAIGLGTYALLPAPADQRGPIALVRLLLTYALIVPPALIGFLGALLLHSAPAGFTLAAATALAEVFPLVEFAAWRIAGNGASFALLESGG